MSSKMEQIIEEIEEYMMAVIPAALKYKDYCQQRRIRRTYCGTSRQNTGRSKALSEDYQQ